MLVQTGWYYRNSPYVDVASGVYIVLDSPVWDHNHSYEKVRISRGEWLEDLIHIPGESVTIMGCSGEHKKYSVYNLVHVGAQDE
jgi:hypothetical protein